MAERDGALTAWVAASVTAVVVLGIWIWLGWMLVEAGDPAGSPGQSTFEQVASVVVVLGLPYVVAMAALAWHAVRGARGDDGPARMLSLATSRQDDWGAAMRAELASIDVRTERWRFALGCVVAALRSGVGRAPWLVALVLLVGFAGATLVMSRVMLAGGRTGILQGVFAVPLVTFLVALGAAWLARSYWTGVVTGVLGLVAALVGALVVAVPESVTWYHEAGVWFIDGDYPKAGIAGPGHAVRDAVGGITFFVLLFGTPWPLIGAALGGLRRPASAAAAGADPAPA
jgi:hypothetical protein